jgi:hypothetical protein
MPIPLLTFICAAFIQTFPSLNPVGKQSVDNFTEWAAMRKYELLAKMDQQSPSAEVTMEVNKLDERVIKFRDSMSFLSDFTHGDVVYRSAARASRRSNGVALDLFSGKEVFENIVCTSASRKRFGSITSDRDCDRIEELEMGNNMRD